MNVDIIHGDIKPDNVLIFKDEGGSYTAKVIDFGYSTRFVSEDDSIAMPRSEPWCAPEHTSAATPAQARKMDMFSYAMLCFWLLFEKSLSGITPLPKDAAREVGQVFEAKRLYISLGVLGDLKRSDKLVQVAQALIRAQQDVDEEMKQDLQEYFSRSLARDAHGRTLRLTKSLDTVRAKG